MDRTVRAMNVRIKEHVASIKKGFHKHTVSRHYLECHNKNPAGTTFTAVDRFTPHCRGSVAKRDGNPLDLLFKMLHAIRVKCRLGCE